MSPTTFGLKALNDPHFVFRLKNGRHRPRPITIHRVKKFMRAYAAQQKEKAL